MTRARCRWCPPCCRSVSLCVCVMQSVHRSNLQPCVVKESIQCLDKGSKRDRVLAKFVENEFEKVDRLMELYDGLAGLVAAEEARLEEEAGSELDEEEVLLARMDAGLVALQQCCQVVGTLWQTGDVGVRRRVLTALHQRGETLGAVRSVLTELWHTLGSDGVLLLLWWWCTPVYGWRLACGMHRWARGAGGAA